jgi:hypothetical protein
VENAQNINSSVSGTLNAKYDEALSGPTMPRDVKGIKIFPDVGPLSGSDDLWSSRKRR